MESVRLRVVFEDRHLLSETQKSEGLKRSLILLKPEFETISDLASYLTHSFDLHHTCPYGIRIFMDGFVLPSFESTRVLKDKDVIRVKRKEGILTDIISLGDDANCLEESDVVEKRPVSTGVELLALEEYENETGGYQNEPEEVKYESPENTLHVETLSGGKTTSKKRKSSKMIHSSKRKKMKRTPENSSKVVVKGVENDVFLKDQSGHYKKVLLEESLHKRRSSKTKVKLKKATNNEVSDIIGDNVGHVPTKKRRDNLQENGEKAIKHVVPEGTRKGPSRSARRKKAKRQWLRELINSRKKELIKTVPDNFVSKNSQEHQESEERTDTEAEIVPIVVKPGHIRFESIDEDGVLHQSNSSVDNFQWNGITSKRKGQKWGMEKASVSWSNGREDSIETENIHWNGITSKKKGHKWGMEKAPASWRNDQKDFRKDSMETENIQWNGITSKKKGQKWGMEKASVSWRNGQEDFREDSMETENIQWNGVTSGRNNEKWGMDKNTSISKVIGDECYREESTEKLNVEEGEFVHDPIDFEKLSSLTCSPKEGDVIAYRLVELSSTWCPELSSFRVGKVSWYDSASNIVMLVLVPGYPIVSEEKTDEEATAEELDTSPYMEDGSLEIDFTSLVDVRVMNHDNSNPKSLATGGSSEALVTNKKTPVSSNEAVSCEKSNEKKEGTHVRTTENGGCADPWEEISQVLNEKKTQLSKGTEDHLTQKESSGKKWSYRALTSGALGPTMALLRAGNGL